MQIREIGIDRPPKYYAELPKLAEGPFAGLPRVFSAVWSLVSHSRAPCGSVGGETIGRTALDAPKMGSVNLRDAAERLLAALEETPPPNADNVPMTHAMNILRNAPPRRSTNAT